MTLRAAVVVAPARTERARLRSIFRPTSSAFRVPALQGAGGRALGCDALVRVPEFRLLADAFDRRFATLVFWRPRAEATRCRKVSGVTSCSDKEATHARQSHLQETGERAVSPGASTREGRQTPAASRGPKGSTQR